MNAQTKAFRFLFVTALSVMMTLLTGVMGAPFVRALQRSQSGWLFWSLGLALTGLFWATGTTVLAVLMASMWLAIGLYSELERRGVPWTWSAFASILVSSVVSFFGYRAILARVGLTDWDRYVGFVGETVTRLKSMNPGVEIEPATLAALTPSVLVIMSILSLAAALIFERRVLSFMGQPFERQVVRLKLRDFRLPDAFIWLTLVAMLFALFEPSGSRNAMIALNVLYVSAVLYFFQGLAVLEFFLNAIKAGLLMRVLSYFVLIGQLYVVLMAVGLVDYWVEFRRRFNRLGTEVENNGNVGSK